MRLKFRIVPCVLGLSKWPSVYTRATGRPLPWRRLESSMYVYRAKPNVCCWMLCIPPEGKREGHVECLRGFTLLLCHTCDFIQSIKTVTESDNVQERDGAIFKSANGQKMCFREVVQKLYC